MKQLIVFCMLLFCTISCDKYTLSGSIVIQNQCDIMPDEVAVSALAINETTLEAEWGKHHKIELVQRADGSYIGQYKLKVKWCKSKEAPESWNMPTIWNDNLNTRVKICESMFCADSVVVECIDRDIALQKIPIQSKDTTFDLKADCRCGTVIRE